ILIPGILGSKLCDAKGKVLWGDNAWDSFTKLNELDLSKGAANGVHSCGIVTSVQVLGPFSVAAYSSLLGQFDKWKLVNGENLFIFDYDWRKSNQENAKLLSTFVTKNIKPGETFNIVAHSMGGLIARMYVERPENRVRVHKIIYMGTPFLG